METDYPLFTTCWKCQRCGKQVNDEAEELCKQCRAELEENWERHRPDEDDEEFWGQPEELDEEQEDVKKVL